MFKGSGVLEMKWYRCCRYYGGLKGGEYWAFEDFEVMDCISHLLRLSDVGR